MSKIRLTRDEKIILAFGPLRGIFDIFSGSFLTAYFVKVSSENLRYLSLYNILVYLMLAVGSFIFGYIIKKNFKIQTMRLSIIINAIYFFSILILGENIVTNLPLVAFLLGFSASAYWMPMNSIVSSKVDNNHRTRFTSLCTVATQVTNIVVPFLLGSLISASNFMVATVVVFVVSIFQIILSFLFKPIPNAAVGNLNYKKMFNIVRKNKQVRMLMFSKFLSGLSISGSALKMLIVLLIIEYYKTDFNLGMITSITALISIVVVDLYGRYYQNRSDKVAIFLSCLCVIVSLFIFIWFKVNILLIFFYIFYHIAVSLLCLSLDIRSYNISNQPNLKALYGEFWSFNELFLNIGRIIGYSGVLLAGTISGQTGLTIMLIALTTCIPIGGVFIKRINKFENGL
ncbi:MFS transporter [Candidatus Saccharibacteria bacterium]|nr:MFS transporter [Candidatus Saccharibacteria bacterium]